MRILSGFLVFVLLLAGWRQLWPEGILFYQGLLLCVVVPLGQGAWCRWGRASAAPGLGKDLLIVGLLAYAFMFTVPTTVDRSYTVRMLQALAVQPAGRSTAEIEADFLQAMGRSGAVARRLQEQQASGLMAPVEGRWRLTDRGRLVVDAFALACRVFACHQPS